MHSKQQALQAAKAYAEVLYSLGSPKNVLEDLLAEFDLFQLLLEREPLLGDFLQGPMVDLATKERVLKTILGDLLSEIFCGCLLVLLRRRHLVYWKEIHEQFRARVDQHFGRVKTVAITAIPWSESEIAQMESTLSQLLEKKVTLTHQTDARILGGVVLYVGDLLIDSSVRHQLHQVRQRILAGKHYEV